MKIQSNIPKSKYNSGKYLQTKLLSEEVAFKEFTLLDTSVKTTIARLTPLVERFQIESNFSEPVANTSSNLESSFSSNINKHNFLTAPFDLFEFSSLTTKPWCVPSLYKGASINNKRSEVLHEKINTLTQALTSNFSVDLLLHIRSLIAELNSLISHFSDVYKRRIKQIRKKFLLYLLLDLRVHYRSMIRFHFKVLNDFSGCEEDEVMFTEILSSKHLFHSKNNFKDVTNRNNSFVN